MSECIFCAIVSGREPCRKVFEDEHTLAFLDAYPVSPGHCLVIPRKHVVWYTDLIPADAGPFSRAVYLVARKVKQAMKAEYVSVLIRGTRVPHLHALLIPRLPGQDNIFDKALDLHHHMQVRLVRELTDPQLDEIAQRIRTANPA